MTIVVPVAIAAPPLPIPDPTDKTTFTARKLSEDDWTRNIFRPAALALGQATHSNALDAKDSALAAATSESGVAINAALAATYGGATAFVAGSNFQQFTVRFSALNQRSYRKQTATNNHSLDPSVDPANWQLISFDRPILIVNSATYAIVQGYDHVLTFAGSVALTGPAIAPTASFGILVDNGREDNTFNPNGFAIFNTTGLMTIEDPFGSLSIRYVNNKYRVSYGL